MLAGSQVGAQETYVLPVPGNQPAAPIWLAQAEVAQKQAPTQPPTTQPAPTDQAPAQAAQPPGTDVFTQAPSTGGEAMAGPNPQMIGDRGPFCVMRTFNLPAVQTTSVFQNTLRQIGIDIFGKLIIQNVPVLISRTTSTVSSPVMACLPVASTAIGFKVADNQSPMPADRVFFTYNYFNNLHSPNAALANGQTISQQTTVNGLTTVTSTVIPGTVPRLDLNGEVIGFEKTFFDGRASIGMRIPLYQQQGDGSFSQQDFGDLGVILNVALYRDPFTGNVLSGGILVTAPTGPSIDTPVGNVHTTYLQPFVGYRWSFSDFYLEGFTSVATPTNSQDVTALFNDVGIGYWLYRGAPDRFLSAIIPTFEAHVTSPLNHRNRNDTVSTPDELDLTSGVHVGFGRRSLLTLGVSVPVTGPRPFNIEGIAQLNFSF